MRAETSEEIKNLEIVLESVRIVINNNNNNNNNNIINNNDLYNHHHHHHNIIALKFVIAQLAHKFPSPYITFHDFIELSRTSFTQEVVNPLTTLSSFQLIEAKMFRDLMFIMYVEGMHLPFVISKQINLPLLALAVVVYVSIKHS